MRYVLHAKHYNQLICRSTQNRQQTQANCAGKFMRTILVPHLWQGGSTRAPPCRKSTAIEELPFGTNASMYCWRMLLGETNRQQKYAPPSAGSVTGVVYLPLTEEATWLGSGSYQVEVGARFKEYLIFELIQLKQLGERVLSSVSVSWIDTVILYCALLVNGHSRRIKVQVFNVRLLHYRLINYKTSILTTIQSAACSALAAFCLPEYSLVL